MNNKTIVAVIIGLLAISGITSVILSNRSDRTSVNQTSPAGPTSTQKQTEQNKTVTANTGDQNTTAIESTEVDIKNFEYVNKMLTVKKGTTVRWTNEDTVKHDVSPDNPGDAFQGSELLAKSESYEWTFNETGTYTYHCSPHPYMTGTVVVTD